MRPITFLIRCNILIGGEVVAMDLEYVYVNHAYCLAHYNSTHHPLLLAISSLSLPLFRPYVQYYIITSCFLLVTVT